MISHPKPKSCRWLSLSAFLLRGALITIGSSLMTSMNAASELERPIVVDQGADTFRRFRYQSAYIALWCVRLARPFPDISSIYCEHIEDALAETPNGEYLAIQVKTRNSGLPPFCHSDEEIIKAIRRFAHSEKHYKKITKYIVATNHGFKNSAGKRPDLFKICQNCRENNADPSVAAYIKRLQTKELSGDNIKSALSKVHLIDDAPKLQDIHHRVADAIAFETQHKSLNYLQLREAAARIISSCEDASSLTSPIDRISILLKQDPGKEEYRHLLESKTIRRDRISNIISGVASEASRPLSTASILSAIPPGSSILVKKMTLGGISRESIEVAENHKLAIEHFLTQILHRTNAKNAQRVVHNLEHIVKRICTETYDELNMKERSDAGTHMLIEVRRRVKEELSSRPFDFDNLNYDQVMGVVSALTEECFVWWGKKVALQ